MNTKVLKALMVLAVLAIALLMGNVLLTGGEDTKTAQSNTDSQAIQVKSCLAKSTNLCCETEKEAGCCPNKCPQCCCQDCCCPQCCCPKTNDAKVCPVESQKPCCPAQ